MLQMGSYWVEFDEATLRKQKIYIWPKGGLRLSEGASKGGESNVHRSRNWNGPDGVITGGVSNRGH